MVEGGRRIATVVGLVVSLLFPLPMPAAAGRSNAPTAAQVNGWGAPTHAEDFTGDLSAWGLYNGEGHDGNGRRTPKAVSVANGILTINGDPAGNSEGMAWGPAPCTAGGRPACGASEGDPDYHAVLLLWPDNEDEGGYGGEIDFMENSDPTRQSTEMFVHYGDEDTQLHGDVDVDATQWHNWAVEWAPDHITAFLDGKQWWSTRWPPPAARPHAHDRPARPVPRRRRPQALQPCRSTGCATTRSPAPARRRPRRRWATPAPTAAAPARVRRPLPPVPVAAPEASVPQAVSDAVAAAITVVSIAATAGSAATGFVLTAVESESPRRSEPVVACGPMNPGRGAGLPCTQPPATPPGAPRCPSAPPPRAPPPAPSPAPRPAPAPALTVLLALFFVFDAVPKLLQLPFVVEATISRWASPRPPCRSSAPCCWRASCSTWCRARRSSVRCCSPATSAARSARSCGSRRRCSGRCWCRSTSASSCGWRSTCAARSCGRSWREHQLSDRRANRATTCW